MKLLNKDLFDQKDKPIAFRFLFWECANGFDNERGESEIQFNSGSTHAR